MRLKVKELSETEYRNKITYVSYVWALLVILLHTYNIGIYTSYITEGDNNVLWDVTRIIENTVDNIAGIAVPGFFFLSGYLFYQNFELKKLLEKWKNRLKTYVVPYLIWSLLPYCFYVVGTHTPIHQYMNMDTVELSIHALIQAVLEAKFSVLWFLKYLIIYTVFAPVFYLLLKNRKIPVGVVSVVLLIILQGQGLLWQINLFYVLGCYIGLNHKKILHYKDNLCDRISLVLLAVLVLGIALIDKRNCLSQLWKGITLLLFWNTANYLPLNKKPAWYFSISFFMYCTHSILLESVEKVLFVLGKNFDWMPLASYMFAPICTLAIIYLAAYVLRKYCQSVWKVITGERG